MNNLEAAEMFFELSDLIDLAGELPFKSYSYRKIAQSLKNLNQPFADIVKEDRFDKIPGAGKAIKEKLKTMVATGKLPTLEKRRKHQVYSFYPWLTLYDIKPRPLGMLIRKFEATDCEDLLKKLKGHDLKKLTGQSKQTAQKILYKNRADYD
jgi:DNA polymerase/3'-5' exonuclease PolX